MVISITVNFRNYVLRTELLRLVAGQTFYWSRVKNMYRLKYSLFDQNTLHIMKAKYVNKMNYF